MTTIPLLPHGDVLPPTRRTRRRWLLVPLVLVLAGCGGGTQQVSQSVPASSVTESPPPSATATDTPAVSSDGVSASSSGSPAAGAATPVPASSAGSGAGSGGPAKPGTTVRGGGPNAVAAPQAAAADTGTLVTVQRSGGLAGVQETVVITSGGGWTATSRGAKGAKGQLAPASLRSLQGLVAGSWQKEASAASAPCADGFSYVVSAGGRVARTTDCSLESQPALSKLTKAVLAGAGL